MTDREKIRKIERMAVMMNERYEALKVKWIDKDQNRFLMASIMGFNTCFFHIFVNISKSDVK